MKNIIMVTTIIPLIFYMLQMIGVLSQLLVDPSEFKSKKHFLWWCIPFVPFIVVIYKSFFLIGKKFNSLK
jgi:hypothetical protein